MILDIISIGDELLIGQTLNTNAHWIAKEMDALGFRVREHISISDAKEHIVYTLDNSLLKADVVLITGGLGPTNDDLTLPVLNEYFGGELVVNQDVYNDIEQLITSRGFEMNDNNKQQALVSSKCKVIRNKKGTAPGLWFEKDNKVVVAMPGVPYEMKGMVETIISWIKQKYTFPEIVHQMVLTKGLPESKLAEILTDWESNLPSTIKLAYLPSPGRVKLRLTSIGQNRAEVQQLIDEQVALLTNIIPDNIYSVDNKNLEEIIGDLLRHNKQTMATAESCTGGYIAHLITSISGSSDYFKGAIVSYANEVKINELRVNSTDIDNYGAVSEQVVVQMAKGVLTKLNVDYAIATSGIAGPTGGTTEKPVGTVWIAVANKNEVMAKKYLFGTDRQVNIERAAFAGLSMLYDLLND
ncbi:competence/damage-inducible protein A [Vicingus serpentipes]|uniref:competence/damage-inducible protein A n=1 Tax=Vicingus serpentipes TaxID=1926625 RepID=UPI001CB9B558|nr:competence/damage-inducible protein A [Vicingus serpentipes]